ncbi:MAG: phosphatase [Microscillaceae bacterium]|nr:phosphatase [Microscillaceae bacterium]
MKFAAIDIGSNGARLLISRVLLENSPNTNFTNKISFKDIEYVRYPLRLGIDVFELGKISKKKKAKLSKLMQAFKLLMDLYEVDDYMVLATSAFREAENGSEVAQQIRKKIGFEIEIIDGIKEAEILNHVIHQIPKENKNYLHIDVGGGSTELNLYRGKQIVASRSFRLGSIRNTEGEQSHEKKDDIREWIEEKKLLFNLAFETIAIGTGGSINKVYALINPPGNERMISDEEIITLRQYLKGFSIHDMVNVLKLNPDRADTIFPASEIYLSCMQWAGAHLMIVPKVGLKDGMMEIMLKRNMQKFLENPQKNDF